MIFDFAEVIITACVCVCVCEKEKVTKSCCSVTMVTIVRGRCLLALQVFSSLMFKGVIAPCIAPCVVIKDRKLVLHEA